MNKNRGKILWIDDEIDLLKPHILFLEEKGYSITKCNNGKEGISQAASYQYSMKHSSSSAFLENNRIRKIERLSRSSCNGEHLGNLVCPMYRRNAIFK